MLRKPKFGKLPPRYQFVINPYPDHRVSSCPRCHKKTGQRKLPLLIHVDLPQLVALNYTCRYCAACDLLIGHKHEIEHLLATLFRQTAPQAVGNDYLIIGTVEKDAWRTGTQAPLTFDQMIASAHDFVGYSELRMSQGGWFPANVEPPERVPPPSTEWVKAKK